MWEQTLPVMGEGIAAQSKMDEAGNAGLGLSSGDLDMAVILRSVLTWPGQAPKWQNIRNKENQASMMRTH